MAGGGWRVAGPSTPEESRDRHPVIRTLSASDAHLFDALPDPLCAGEGHRRTRFRPDRKRVVLRDGDLAECTRLLAERGAEFTGGATDRANFPTAANFAKAGFPVIRERVDFHPKTGRPGTEYHPPGRGPRLGPPTRRAFRYRYGRVISSIA